MMRHGRISQVGCQASFSGVQLFVAGVPVTGIKMKRGPPR